MGYGGGTLLTYCTKMSDQNNNKFINILRDNTNTLKVEFDSQLNFHSCRYKAPKVHTSRYHNSFVTTAISVFSQRGRGQACFQMND